MAKRKNCGDCGTKEGQLHILGCDMEGCPFCGNQLILPVRLQKAGDRRFARLAGPLSRPHRRTTRRLGNCSRLALLRLQSWLSPAFPTGAYSYSHGLEWAVEAGDIHDRETLVDWLQADLCYGSGRNEAIFFSETWRCATADDREKLFEVAELAASFRGPGGMWRE